jgi:Zinc-binding dehydrogenase
MASRTAENLERLGALLVDGTLRIHVQATYELAEAPQALAALPAEHTQGKLAVHVGCAWTSASAQPAETQKGRARAAGGVLDTST